jgi:uncharacterized protein
MKQLTTLIASSLLLLSDSTHGSFDTALANYESGNYKEAFMEFEALAANGDATAQYSLGRMYYEGKGTAVDKVQAYMWISLASNLGYQKATKYNVILKSLMSPSQVEEAERRTDRWLKKNSH